MNRPGLGVVIGRFQVPDLHEGHKFLIETANEHQRTLVFIGTHSSLLTKNHPLDYPAREAMIKKHFPDVMVAPLPDQPTDKSWSKQIDELIRQRHTLGQVILYGGPDSFMPHYSGHFSMKEVDRQRINSGTEIRDSVAQVVLPSEDFRQGMIYASRNVYPRVKLTVDIAMIQDVDKSMSQKLSPTDRFYAVLVGSKKSQPGLWRFPGGFVDVNDAHSEAAARRELREETGLTAEHRLYFIGNYRIGDWRDVPDSRTFTNFYTTPYFAGGAKAGDDLDEVKWVECNGREFDRVNWADDHNMLATELLNWLEVNDVRKS